VLLYYQPALASVKENVVYEIGKTELFKQFDSHRRLTVKSSDDLEFDVIRSKLLRVAQ